MIGLIIRRGVNNLCCHVYNDTDVWPEVSMAVIHPFFPLGALECFLWTDVLELHGIGLCVGLFTHPVLQLIGLFCLKSHIISFEFFLLLFLAIFFCPEILIGCMWSFCIYELFFSPILEIYNFPELLSLECSFFF